MCAVCKCGVCGQVKGASLCFRNATRRPWAISCAAVLWRRHWRNCGGCGYARKAPDSDPSLCERVASRSSVTRRSVVFWRGLFESAADVSRVCFALPKGAAHLERQKTARRFSENKREVERLNPPDLYLTFLWEESSEAWSQLAPAPAAFHCYSVLD